VVINLDGYQGVMLHNYYLYEVDGRFSVIPWDFNMSFAGFSATVSKDGGYLYIDTPVSGTTMEARPLVNALLSDKTYLERYRGYLRELVEGVFSEEFMRTQIAGLTKLIDPYVKADPTSFFSYAQFQAAVDLDAPANLKSAADGLGTASPQFGGMMGGNTIALMSFVRGWRANILAQLAGDLPSVGTVTSNMGGIAPGGGGVVPPVGAMANDPGGLRGGAFPGGAFPGGGLPDGAFPGGAFPDGAFPGGDLPGGVPKVVVQPNVEVKTGAAAYHPAEWALMAASSLALLTVALLLRRSARRHAI
jgi:spore coat protein H